MKPDARIRLCAIGFGNRTRKYLKYAESNPDGVELCAVVDTDPFRLEEAMSLYGMEGDRCFLSVEDFFASGVPVDAVLVATTDKSHYSIAMKVLDKGLHLLLEKPMAGTSLQCLELVAKAEQAGVAAGLCYIMRYHPYYRRIKEIADSGELGRIISISHREIVGIDRMTHTFVRGNWSREEDSSPIFISKCCHDVDFLMWLTGSTFPPDGMTGSTGVPVQCTDADMVADIQYPAVCGYEVSSVGSLSRYCPSSAPEEAAERCIHCPIEGQCRYSAVDLYQRRREWTGNFPASGTDDSDDVIAHELCAGRYGRCVYHCDNDVMDYQEVTFVLPDGIKIEMVLDGISDSDGRETVIRFEKGHLTAKDGRIVIRSYGTADTASEGGCGAKGISMNAEVHEREEDYREICARPLHAGADMAIMEDFFNAVRTGSRMQCTLRDALTGSLAAISAEKARSCSSR